MAAISVLKSIGAYFNNIAEGRLDERQAANELTGWAWKAVMPGQQSTAAEQVLTRLENLGFAGLSRMSPEQRAASSIERIAIATALDEMGETGALSASTGHQLRVLGEVGHLQYRPGGSLSADALETIAPHEVDTRIILKWAWLSADKGMNAASPEEFVSRFENNGHLQQETPQSQAILSALNEIRAEGKISGETGFKLRVLNGI